MVFQILAKIKMTLKIGYLDTIWNGTPFFFFFFFFSWNMVVINVHIHDVEMIFKKSGGKVVFLGGFRGIPLGTNGRESTLVT